MSVNFYRLEYPVGTPLEPLLDYVVKLLGACKVPHTLPVVPNPELTLSHPIKESEEILLRNIIDLQLFLQNSKLTYSTFELFSAKHGPNFIELGFNQGEPNDPQISFNC